jgi:hypothetical protein
MSTNRLKRKAISLIAALMLTTPISVSVLCISPDGHIAIESLNADCCISAEILAYQGHSQNDAICAHDECLNCTDLPLFSNESGTIQRSYSFSVAGASAYESCQKQPEANAASRSLLRNEYAGFLISPAASSAVPLRC